jgi:hypothetical protein
MSPVEDPTRLVGMGFLSRYSKEVNGCGPGPRCCGGTVAAAWRRGRVQTGRLSQIQFQACLT